MGVLNNLINSIKDNFTMAEFNINGRMTVSSLRKSIIGLPKVFEYCTYMCNMVC